MKKRMFHNGAVPVGGIVVVLVLLALWSVYNKKTAVHETQNLERFFEEEIKIPGSGEENFSPPATDQREKFRVATRAWLDNEAQLEDIQRHALEVDYQCTEMEEVTPHGQRIYRILKESVTDCEDPRFRGLGTYIHSPLSTGPFCIEIPHPLHDIHTLREGLRVFKAVDAQFFLVSGTHRNNNAQLSDCIPNRMSEYALSDVCHNTANFFHPAHEEIVDAREQLFFIQLHGFNGTTEARIGRQILLTDGVGRRVGPLRKQLTRALESRGFSVANFDRDLYRSSDKPGDEKAALLGAVHNVQGIYLNFSPEERKERDCCQDLPVSAGERFVHIEQSRDIRESAEHVEKLIRALQEVFVKTKK